MKLKEEQYINLTNEITKLIDGNYYLELPVQNYVDYVIEQLEEDGKLSEAIINEKFLKKFTYFCMMSSEIVYDKIPVGIQKQVK